jgi:methane/ammonia monooxygenase subunit B
VNGVPARQSFADFKLGGEYEFEVTMEGRIPGRHHIHPSLSVKGAGALVGPGMWIEVVDTGLAHQAPVTAISGEFVPDLATWGFGHVMSMQLAWLALGAVWLLWWVHRPLLLPRWIALKKDREDVLYSGRDVLAAFVLGLVCVGLSIGTYSYAVNAYPYTVPLQAGTMKTDPRPQASDHVRAEVLHATYDVPGRSMKLKVELRNEGPVPMTLGELTTANIRFLNQALPVAAAAIPANFPTELIAPSGLQISDASPLQPGEVRVVDLEATDSVWENERLVSFLTDVDSKLGALLFFFDPNGQREIVEIDGAILPVFTDL